MRPSKNPKFGLFPESGNTADRNRLDTVDTKFPVDFMIYRSWRHHMRQDSIDVKVVDFEVCLVPRPGPSTFLEGLMNGLLIH